MTDIRRIHWGRILVAAFLAEASVMAGFFLLLFAATFAVNTVAELVRQRLRRRYAQL